MYILMPVPELKTGQIDWNNPAIIEQVKMKFTKQKQLNHLKDYVTISYPKLFLHP